MDEDKYNVKKIQIAGKIFIYWPDHIEHAIYAQDTDTNKIELIGRTGLFIPVETKVREAIAEAFNL